MQLPMFERNVKFGIVNFSNRVTWEMIEFGKLFSSRAFSFDVIDAA